MAARCPLLDGIWVLLPGRSILGLSVCSGKPDLKCHPIKWEVSALKALSLWDLSPSGETRWGGEGTTASSLLGSCMRLGELGTARCVPLAEAELLCADPCEDAPFSPFPTFSLPCSLPSSSHPPTPQKWQ